MPELPEVETTKRGIEPHIVGQTIKDIIIRNPSLRWPIPSTIQNILGEEIISVARRAKYLLIETPTGSALVHLGMSGSLRLCSTSEPPSYHDHVDLILDKMTLRYTDPRRFGCWLFVPPGESHKLLDNLGPEPISKAFSTEHLVSMALGRKISIKQFIMTNSVVVGVGNIYATEALFLAGINPIRAAGRISKVRMEQLRNAIVDVLLRAIEDGGTSLKDFVNSDGKPGYFKQRLNVYGRGGKACLNCNNTLKEIRQGGRATVYCTHCQR